MLQPLVKFSDRRLAGGRPIVTKLADRLDDSRNHLLDALKLLFELVSHGLS